MKTLRGPALFRPGLLVPRFELASLASRNPTYDHLPTQEWSFRGNRGSVSGVVATTFGATGFLGAYVVERLASTGSQCIIPFRGEENHGTGIVHLKVLGEPGNILPTRFHLRNQESIEHAAAPANVVINMLGKWWDTRNFKTREANVKSAEAIAKASQGAARYIFVSAVGADKRSASQFYRDKAEAEKVTREILPNATIIRTTRMYGDEDNFLNKYGYIARQWPFLPKFYRDVEMQPIWVGDVAAAIHKCLLYPETAGQTYEIAGADRLTHHEFQEVVKKTTKLNPREINIPPGAMEYFASWNEMLRIPTFTQDEIVRFGIPNIPSGQYPGLLKTLELSPHTLDEMAIHHIRQYRHPATQSDVY